MLQYVETCCDMLGVVTSNLKLVKTAKEASYNNAVSIGFMLNVVSKFSNAEFQLGIYI